MAQATVTDAEAAFAALAGLSDNQRQEFQAEVTAARASATQAGVAEAERIANTVRDTRDDLLRDLCSVRDGLAAAKASGDRAVLADLRTRHRSLLRQVEEIERLAEQAEAIEADPFAYGEAIFAKYQQTRPHFTFI